jgi:hypothetical protein
MSTPIERLQTALATLGLKAVEARLENLLEEAAKKEPSLCGFFAGLTELRSGGATDTLPPSSAAVSSFSFHQDVRTV